MKDKRIWPFKRRAEEDNLITAGACRLILRIASWRYCTKHHPADAEFALSWRDMAAWYDNDGPERIRDKKTIYEWLRELVHARYLHYNGRKGCPAKSCYRLELDFKPERLTLFDWAAEQASRVFRSITSVDQKNGQLVDQKNGQPECRKTAPLVDQKTGQQVVRKNRPPTIRYSLREEMYKTKGKKLARRGARKRGRVGAREREGGMGLTHGSGKGASTAPAAQRDLLAEDRATLGSDPSAASKAGGASPPGRGRKAPALSAESRATVALHAARLYVADGAFHWLDEEHVRALIHAGDSVPVEALAKFPHLRKERAS